MGEENMDDFIRLKNNLRGGITQIVTRYAKVDLNKVKQSQVQKAFIISMRTICMEEQCIE